jgi:serine/threonine-protein kinase
MFTGRLPFGGDSIMRIVLAHIQQPPPAPRSVNPRIPEGLERVILRALEKSPQKRYQTVSEILDDLSEVSASVDAAAA